jgi:hypothetical protein
MVKNCSNSTDALDAKQSFSTKLNRSHGSYALKISESICMK